VTDRITEALEAAVADARPLEGGALADYIPELGTADPTAVGIALVGVGGRVFEAGDSGVEFTIQSISKPFVYALALEHLGIDAVLEKVGVEPSGEPFNAISLDDSGRPKNPMINAGAIVAASLVPGDVVRDGLALFAGRDLRVDDAVFRSELETGHRNRALAHLALAAGVLGTSVDAATEDYFRQCSLLVSARDVATMAATLANAGFNPLTGERVVSEPVARWTLAVMASCGMYDASGEWLARVGLPAKSGVGGGIVAVDPGLFGIGTFSPPLDERGNSVRGCAMLESLSAGNGFHAFAHPDYKFSV
jgi:glutaminase